MTPAEKAKETRRFKKDICGSCVYSCKHMPYDKRHDCAVTDEMVLEAVDVCESRIRYMAQFCITGEIQKKRSWVIGWGPRGGIGFIQMKRLSPPFDFDDRLSVPEYLSRSDIDPSLFDEVCHDLSGREEEFLKRSFWMLSWMDDRFRHDHSFYNHTQDNGRFSRNDVLAICFEPEEDRIVVRSDTRASGKGMNMAGEWWPGRKQESLRPFERPRFKTTYEHPYYEDISRWAGAAPDSGREACHLISRSRGLKRSSA